MSKSRQEKKMDECIKKITPLLDALTPNIFVRDPLDYTHITSSDYHEKTIRYAAIRIFSAFRALLEIHTCIEDVGIIYKMAGSYPWKKKILSRSHHIRIVWLSYENQCYIFREKIKLYYNMINSMEKIYPNSQNLSPKEILKKIDKNLGRHIQARGNTVHSFNEKHQAISHFELVEISNVLKLEVPVGFYDIKGHYSEAKWEIRREISSCYDFMARIFCDELRVVNEIFLSRINELNKYCSAAKEAFPPMAPK